MLDEYKAGKSVKLILIALLALVLLFVYFYHEDYKTISEVETHIDGDDMIRFSLDTGMYEESLSLKLKKDSEVPRSAQIYYTLNGDDPTIENGVKYSSAIQLEKSDDFVVYPLKAVIYYKGEYSSIYEKTYILCDDATNEFDLDIVSITSDSANLYDYEKGILVAGKIHDDWIAENGQERSSYHGNYWERGEEWIRNAFVTIVDSNGNIIIDQEICLGVSGGTSSGKDVKSLKLVANAAGDEGNDSFNLCLENSDKRWLDYSWVEKYNSIRLRSGGQDQDYGNIRSAIVSRLAQDSNFDGITSSNRCIVFLNGDFYGIFDIQQNYSDSYLANRFGLDDSDAIEKSKGRESTIFDSLGLTKLFDQDLDNAVNRETLENCIDMDNYLLYYSIQILCNNTDWPNNNYEIWRYTGNYDDENPYSDGRYRFLIYDTDLVYHRGDTPEFFEGVDGDVFVGLMDGTIRASGSSFPKVMESKYYRDKFITLICDLMNTSFSTEHILEIVDEEDKKIRDARIDFYGYEYEETAEESIGLLVQAVLDRPEEMEINFEKYFGLTDKYHMDLETSEGVLVQWNNMEIYANSSYSNDYYYEVNWTLEADAYPGYEFQYWEVNGGKVYEKSLEISDEMIAEGSLFIRAVATVVNEPSLVIQEVSAKGSLDWIEIYNAGNVPIQLDQYYLSDNDEDWMKYRLPEIVLGAGESVKIDGSKNYDSLGDYICNFSLSEYETLILSDGNIIYDSMEVPKMSGIETYGRYDNSNRWVYYLK